MKNYFFFVAALFILQISLAACSNDNPSIYQNLAPEADGVIDAEIPNDDDLDKEQPINEDDQVVQEPDPEPDPEPNEPEPHPSIDNLDKKEKQLVDKHHESDYDKISFMVVDVANNTIVKSYFANKLQRLASVTKIPNSIAALENVNNISTYKVGKMLKGSYNGEASRYLHLAAKAIDGTTIEEKPYTQRHSCPDPFLEEPPLAAVAFDWMTAQLPDVDWTGAAWFDGAGCHYDNFMNSWQTLKILEWADGRGKAYGGKTYEKLLSISGTDGTWRKRNKDHKGRILAKTGTLRPNSNLAGYFYARRAKKMRKYYFTVFVQKKGAGQYTTKSRQLIEDLLRYWINSFSKSKGEDLGPFVN